MPLKVDNLGLVLVIRNRIKNLSLKSRTLFENNDVVQNARSFIIYEFPSIRKIKMQ